MSIDQNQQYRQRFTSIAPCLMQTSSCWSCLPHPSLPAVFAYHLYRPMLDADSALCDVPVLAAASCLDADRGEKESGTGRPIIFTWA